MIHKFRTKKYIREIPNCDYRAGLSQMHYDDLSYLNKYKVDDWLRYFKLTGILSFEYIGSSNYIFVQAKKINGTWGSSNFKPETPGKKMFVRDSDDELIVSEIRINTNYHAPILVRL